jgi:hypothetical protein
MVVTHLPTEEAVWMIETEMAEQATITASVALDATGEAPLPPMISSRRNGLSLIHQSHLATSKF